MKEIESTDRDLRKLHMPQLRGRLVDMGINAEDVGTLNRWDLTFVVGKVGTLTQIYSSIATA